MRRGDACRRLAGMGDREGRPYAGLVAGLFGYRGDACRRPCRASSPGRSGRRVGVRGARHPVPAAFTTAFSRIGGRRWTNTGKCRSQPFARSCFTTLPPGPSPPPTSARQLRNPTGTAPLPRPSSLGPVTSGDSRNRLQPSGVRLSLACRGLRRPSLRSGPAFGIGLHLATTASLTSARRSGAGGSRRRPEVHDNSLGPAAHSDSTVVPSILARQRPRAPATTSGNLLSVDAMPGLVAGDGSDLAGGRHRSASTSQPQRVHSQPAPPPTVGSPAGIRLARTGRPQPFGCQPVSCAFSPSLQPRPSSLLRPLLTSARLSTGRSPRVRCMNSRAGPFGLYPMRLSVTVGFRVS